MARIVWLNEHGNAVKQWIRAAEPGRRMVTVKPGDTVALHDRSQKVVDVTVYRALAVDAGYEVVG